MFGKKHSGFTLIEILIALAILGIIVAIAIPSYGDYVKRSKVAEAVVLSEEARMALISNHVKSRIFSSSDNDPSVRNVDIGLNDQYDYATDTIQRMWVGGTGVQGADDTSAYVAILLDSELGVGTDGGMARLLSTVEYKDGEYIYICGNSQSTFGNHIEPEYLPENCRN